MTNKFLLLICLFTAAIFSSCNKVDDNNNNNSTACNGKNLCMKIDGVQLSENAKWVTISSGRRRILWETGTGASYQNIELDIYDTVATNGPFTVSDNPGAGQAGFQYFSATPSKNIQGMSGTVNLSSTANNTLSGTFTITAKDMITNATVQITEGNFVNVPK